MDEKTALEVSARIWCDQDYSHVIMNAKLAKKIAKLLMNEANSQAAQQLRQADAAPALAPEG